MLFNCRFRSNGCKVFGCGFVGIFAAKYLSGEREDALHVGFAVGLWLWGSGDVDELWGFGRNLDLDCGRRGVA